MKNDWVGKEFKKMIYVRYFEDVYGTENSAMVSINNGIRGQCIKEMCPTLKEIHSYKKNKKKYGQENADIMFGKEYKERLKKIGIGTLVGKISEKSGVNDAMSSMIKSVILIESKTNEPKVGKYVIEFFNAGNIKVKEWQ